MGGKGRPGIDVSERVRRSRIRHHLLLPSRSVGTAAAAAAAGDRHGAAGALLPAPRRISGRCHLADAYMKIMRSNYVGLGNLILVDPIGTV